MKKYIIFLLILMIYFFGFVHGINSSFVEDRVQRTLLENNVNNFNNLINNTYGVIQIEVIADNKEEAESDFLVKVSLARFNHWTMVGEKKSEQILSKYRVYQSAMRFQE